MYPSNRWLAGVYSFLVLGVTAATIKEKKFPKVAAVPLFVMGVVMAYNYDFAYGTKMHRVRLEAEHILEHERERLVPISVMPPRKYWEAEANSPKLQGIKRVGEHWPFIGSYKQH